MTQRRKKGASLVSTMQKARERVEEKNTYPTGGADQPMTTTTIHLPIELLAALRNAANRRTLDRARNDPRGRGGRPSVSEIIVDILERHRNEIE